MHTMCVHCNHATPSSHTDQHNVCRHSNILNCNLTISLTPITYHITHDVSHVHIQYTIPEYVQYHNQMHTHWWCHVHKHTTHTTVVLHNTCIFKIVNTPHTTHASWSQSIQLHEPSFQVHTTLEPTTQTHETTTDWHELHKSCYGKYMLFIHHHTIMTVMTWMCVVH